jgi:SAM-dependent methyltransferase
MSASAIEPARFWDGRFAESPAVYGEAPNAWLVECEAKLAPAARVLCLAEGQGRNALWLARRGHAVQALDLSAVAMAQLAQAAEAQGLSLEARQQDLADWQPTPASVDAVVIVFAHFPPSLRARVHAAAATALRPGGWLVLECFAREQLGRSSGGPRELDWLFDEDVLRVDFAGLQIERLERIDDVLDEGAFHQGQAVRWRLLARRPLG